jgi:hypothetical protein
MCIIRTPPPVHFAVLHRTSTDRSRGRATRTFDHPHPVLHLAMIMFMPPLGWLHLARICGHRARSVKRTGRTRRFLGPTMHPARAWAQVCPIKGGVKLPGRAVDSTIGGQLAQRVAGCVGKGQIVTPAAVAIREAGAVQVGAGLASRFAGFFMRRRLPFNPIPFRLDK